MAGLTGAALFAACGPVIFISHLATHDMTMLALVTVATWLGVRGARRDGMMLVWLVSGLLALAFFVKYAGIIYVPLVFAVCIAAGWGRFRWLTVRQALAGLALTLTLIFAALVTVGAQPGSRHRADHPCAQLHGPAVDVGDAGVGVAMGRALVPAGRDRRDRDRHPVAWAPAGNYRATRRQRRRHRGADPDLGY